MQQIEVPSDARPMPRFPEFVAMIALLMALTALSIDMMLPALPQIHSDFSLAGLNDQQLVVTLYVLGFALGQLFQGPLSDRYGRRVVLLTGLGVYAVAAFVCMIADSYQTLLIARFVQGLANAAPRIIAIAVVRDIYSGRRMAEVMSFVMMVFIMAPVVAPSIGGAFLLVSSWHVIFGFLGLMSLTAVIWVGLRLPETHPTETREPMSVAWLVEAFTLTLTTRQTLGYTLAAGIMFGALMGYINSVQQVLVEIYDIGAWFPVIFGIVAVTLAVAAYLNARLVMRIGMRRIAHGAVIGFAVSAVLHLLVYLAFGTPPLPVFLILIGCCMFFFGLVMPNTNALAMEPMGHIAGTASSFVGAVTTGIAALFGLAIGQSYSGTVLPLLLGFALLGVLGLITVLITEKGKLFRVNPA